MKLLFIRHAEAQPSATFDKNRNLTPQGIIQAKAAANALSTLNVGNMKFRVSSANRTLETWSEIANVLGILDPPVVDEGLYGAEVDYYRDCINESSNTELGFIGHNPTISHLVSVLTNTTLELNLAEWVAIDYDVKTATGVILRHWSLKDNY